MEYLVNSFRESSLSTWQISFSGTSLKEEALMLSFIRDVKRSAIAYKGITYRHRNVKVYFLLQTRNIKLIDNLRDKGYFLEMINADEINPDDPDIGELTPF